mgnify:CR=1 FL=1
MKDKFDKMFSDIEWDSDAELTYQTGLKKISLHNKAKYKSEAERVKASERMKKVLQRPDVQEARRIGFENRDYTNIAKANKEKANRPDIVAKLKEHQAKMNTDKEFVENRAQRNKELAQSEDWLKATRSAQLELKYTKQEKKILKNIIIKNIKLNSCRTCKKKKKKVLVSQL